MLMKEKKVLKLFFNDPRATPWLHRIFRKQYIRGHTYVKNQIVYQKAGYKAKRINRQLIEIYVAGLTKRKRIKLVVKSNRLPKGTIRLIETDRGLEIHTPFTRTIPKKPKEGALGLDKGYTEAFYTSNGDKVGIGLGELMTAKTERIVKTNRNRYRLHQHQKKRSRHNPVKAAQILKNNLGYKVKQRKSYKLLKIRLKTLIRRDLRRVIKEPTNIFVEDLTIPIRGKKVI